MFTYMDLLVLVSVMVIMFLGMKLASIYRWVGEAGSGQIVVENNHPRLPETSTDINLYQRNDLAEEDIWDAEIVEDTELLTQRKPQPKIEPWSEDGYRMRCIRKALAGSNYSEDDVERLEALLPTGFSAEYVREMQGYRKTGEGRWA